MKLLIGCMLSEGEQQTAMYYIRFLLYGNSFILLHSSLLCVTPMSYLALMRVCSSAMVVLVVVRCDTKHVGRTWWWVVSF